MSSLVESTSSSSSSVALLYRDIWKVKLRKDSLSASMFPPLASACMSARDVWSLSSPWGFRVEFQDISGFVLSLSSSTQTQELVLKECVSAPSFQRHFPAPCNPNKTSHSPHGVWQTPHTHPRFRGGHRKPPSLSPCNIVVVPLGQNFLPGLPTSAQSAQIWHERSRNKWKNRKERWLDFLHDWDWVCGRDCASTFPNVVSLNWLREGTRFTPSVFTIGYGALRGRGLDETPSSHTCLLSLPVGNCYLTPHPPTHSNML